ncbi:hypothetical protein MesoLjLc_09150 [Mesorhizobium sp. L-8-10]|uniref:hypothetical protein n=1 Tax=Mesorhizobium sp. L-8-10 TaxID=2744523 RepID=UPI0019297513|nr:hypothetical protein [Mesorhizobium sp. L-8-10]BCH28985.1 hypothetical protein MesoLjLc_09150 [Mesorhizobium sp. L-8-10]
MATGHIFTSTTEADHRGRSRPVRALAHAGIEVSVSWGKQKDISAMDIVVLAIGMIFFGLCFIYLKACDSL